MRDTLQCSKPAISIALFCSLIDVLKRYVRCVGVVRVLGKIVCVVALAADAAVLVLLAVDGGGIRGA